MGDSQSESIIFGGLCFPTERRGDLSNALTDLKWGGANAAPIIPVNQTEAFQKTRTYAILTIARSLRERTDKKRTQCLDTT